MTIEAISYARGSANSPYLGRVELELLPDEQFTASYEHRGVKREWRGKLTPGTFAKAFDALASTGFPNVPALGELVPGESPRVFGWLSDGTWMRAKVKESAVEFSQFIGVTSTILGVLDSSIARMPPGETTPIVEHHLVGADG